MRDGWVETTLGEAAEVSIGRQRSPRNASGEHMVKYLRAANVKDGRLALGDVLSMNFSPAEQATFQLAPGDVLVTEGCGSIRELGASAVWNAELDGTVCFQNTVLRCPAHTGCERLRDLSGPPLRLWVFPDLRPKEGTDVVSP